MRKTRCLKVGEKVKLARCPFDEQIAEEAMRYACLKGVEMVVLETKKVPFEGASGQWIKVDKITGWIDKAWFKPIATRRNKTLGDHFGEE